MSHESRVMTRQPWVIWVLETCLVSVADEKFSDFGSLTLSFALAALASSLYFIKSD